ncbi:MAG TPA: DUF167 family protein [Devosia sp.]|nr:DUF167 family protein [Devosia sp.]
MTLCYRTSPDGLVLHIRVTPNAGADRIEGAEIRDDGTAVLRLRVAAVPDRGRANTAAIALLAKALGLPKSAITLTAGETARFKTLRLLGDPARIAAAIDALTPA